MQILNKLHAFNWDSSTENNCNAYLINGSAKILIDPGHIHIFDHVQNGLADIGIGIGDISLVICTHAHPDHIEAAMLFKQSSVLFTVHENEWDVIKTMVEYYKDSSSMNLQALTPDFFLTEGDFSVKDIQLRVFHTPGHSPGSASIYWPDGKSLFTGDLIFKDSVGRTDLPGGDTQLLKESITSLSNLETEFILPGHGEIISGTEDVKENFDNIERFVFPRL